MTYYDEIRDMGRSVGRMCERRERRISVIQPDAILSATAGVRDQMRLTLLMLVDGGSSGHAVRGAPRIAQIHVWVRRSPSGALVRVLQMTLVVLQFNFRFVITSEHIVVQV